MRMLMVGVTLGVLLAGAAFAAAQDAKPVPGTFSGVKLVDTQARTPEQSVTVTVGKEHVRVIDPAAAKDLKVLAYSGLSATHNFGKMPPGAVAAPATTERNWLTLKSGADEVTLRVSDHVYTQLKTALESHGVKIEEAK
jgi:hypothetical protein